MSPDRHILFLQGPPGSFFARLAQILMERGCIIHRVNFNGGDQRDWPFPGAFNYRRGRDSWAGWLGQHVRSKGITDIVLFGDCRPLHRAARATAAGFGIPVHVFEEGYLRPDWITLERGGVNGFSPLPLDPGWWEEAARPLPAVPPRLPLPSTIAKRIRETSRYYLGYWLYAWAYPNYQTHRPWAPSREAIGWIRNLLRGRGAATRSATAQAQLRPGEYFLVPLQLDSDYQLRSHSDFDGMQAALAGILASFAATAPANCLLAVKAHPLDNGLTDWAKLCAAWSQDFVITDRFVFLEAGDIEPLVRCAKGVVTVNSTSGTIALAAGVPVIALGRAVYAIPGLTEQRSLECFWSDPQKPDPALFEAFRRVLVARSLVHGGFYTDEAVTSVVEACAERMLSHGPAITARPRLRVVAGIGAQTPVAIL